MHAPSFTLVIGVLLASAASAAGAADDQTQSAQWTQKEFQFTYQGFTTHYSCDGLRDKVQSIVLQLGARKDSRISEFGCTSSLGRPDPFPGVRGKIWVLEPLAQPESANAKESGPVVRAQWKHVKLKLDTDPLGEAGECELVEQLQQRVLPLFATRDVKFNPECIPHQLTLGGNELSADVMVPQDKSDSVAAAH
jgi:hypothetical protein